MKYNSPALHNIVKFIETLTKIGTKFDINTISKNNMESINTI